MKYLYPILIAVSIMAACKGQEKNQDTVLLEQYLKKQFNEEIKKDNVTYVLLADQACSGCANYIFEAAKSPPRHYIFILPKPSNNYSYDHSTILIDSSANLGRLKFHRGNVCTIKTHNGLVYDPSEVKNIFK